MPDGRLRITTLALLEFMAKNVNRDDTTNQDLGGESWF